MRRLNKRGMDDKISFTIWEMMVILMVVIALTVSVRGIANNTTYWKKYHSADLALMSEIMIGSQGDFVINYDMKEMKQNGMTRLLRIDQLAFQTFLKTGSFFVYDESVHKDRFPQSYIFAEDRDVRVIGSNITADYIVLYKSGDSFWMKSEYVAPAFGCPAVDTASNISEKKFNTLALSEGMNTYSEYINFALKTLGKGTENELLIVLIEDNDNPTKIFYNPLRNIKSEKISCLTKRALEQRYPDMTVGQDPYDKSWEVEPFISQRDGYMYWMLISVNSDEVEVKNLKDALEQAIKEYYVIS